MTPYMIIARFELLPVHFQNREAIQSTQLGSVYSFFTSRI